MTATVKRPPIGAIRRVEEFQHWLEYVKETGEEVLTYWVSLFGYTLELYLTKNTRTREDHIGQFVEGLEIREDVGKRYTTSRSLRDYNIVPNTYNDHFVFTNRIAAERYSRFLGADSTHRAAVEAHWENVSRSLRWSGGDASRRLDW